MRTTLKQLELQVTRINKLTNSPLEYLTVTDGKRDINIGHYHLDQAYGGIKLVRAVTNGGGIELVSRNGYGTKRELFVWMDAFITGLESIGGQD